jgi:hypothetical protein
MSGFFVATVASSVLCPARSRRLGVTSNQAAIEQRWRRTNRDDEHKREKANGCLHTGIIS